MNRFPAKWGTAILGWKLCSPYYRISIKFLSLKDLTAVISFLKKSQTPTKWGIFWKWTITIGFLQSRELHFFLFHQEFPTLLDFKHSLFCRILQIWFGQISCKIGNCYTRLNIVFPILKDFKKIPQFEGLVILSKATKWGIF